MQGLFAMLPAARAALFSCCPPPILLWSDPFSERRLTVCAVCRQCWLVGVMGPSPVRPYPQASPRHPLRHLQGLSRRLLPHRKGPLPHAGAVEQQCHMRVISIAAWASKAWRHLRWATAISKVGGPLGSTAQHSTFHVVSWAAPARCNYGCCSPSPFPLGTQPSPLSPGPSTSATASASASAPAAARYDSLSHSARAALYRKRAQECRRACSSGPQGSAVICACPQCPICPAPAPACPLQPLPAPKPPPTPFAARPAPSLFPAHPAASLPVPRPARYLTQPGGPATPPVPLPRPAHTLALAIPRSYPPLSTALFRQPQRHSTSADLRPAC